MKFTGYKGQDRFYGAVFISLAVLALALLLFALAAFGYALSAGQVQF